MSLLSAPIFRKECDIMPVYKNEQRGTWFASFYFVDWTGKRLKKKKEGFKTRREALMFERDFLAKSSGQCDMKFSSFVDIYLATARKNLKPSTVWNKEKIIRTHIMPYFKDYKLDKITPVIIRQWQDTLNDGTKAGQYLRSIRIQLSCIFNFAVKYYNLNKNPVRLCDPIGNSKSRSLDFWTVDEFNKFSNALEGHEPAYTMFNILFWTGMRRGELFALRPKDFDFEKQTVSITRNLILVKGKRILTTPKTEKSNRTIKIPSFLAEIVQNYLRKDFIDDDELLFEQNINYMSKLLGKWANIAGIKRIRPHDIRHSHASLLINEGFSILMIAQRLGHENIETTLKRYGHLYPSKEETLMQRLESLHK